MSELNSEPGGPIRFRPAFEQCRRQAFSTVTTNVAELLTHTGDALLDFADKAQTNVIQQEFFAARGVVLAHRETIQAVFQKCFNQAFDDLGKPRPPRAWADTEGGEDGLGLSLLDFVQMDENVATETLVGKAKDRCYTELYALRQRLSVVAGGRQLGEEEVPAGPGHLVNCFRNALQGIDIEVKIRVILYALFDKYVLQEVGSLYAELNETLKNAGVLPNLKHLISLGKNAAAAGSVVPEDEVRRQPRGQQPRSEPGAQPSAESGSEQSAEAPPGVADELLGAILQLMAGRRARFQAAAAGQGATGSARFGALVNRVKRETLIATINNLQSRSHPRYASAFSEPAAAARLGSDPDFVESVKNELMAEREAFFSQVNPEQMAPIDVDAIDIVGLLFEYMLNDPELPNLAKALLSRLHTPYLKAALLDRHLLYKDNHCARQLLDLMVEAGESYVHESAPAWGVFPTLRTMVERILAEFTDKLTLFEELLKLLHAEIKQQRHKTTTMEERARQAAMGRDKFQVAKQRAAAEIDGRIHQSQVLPEVAAFLSHVWLNELVFVLLRSPLGEDAAEWLRALEVADQLVGLGHWAGPATSKSQLDSTLPQLRTAIEAGLDTLGGNRPVEWDALAPLLTDPERLLRRLDEVRMGAKWRTQDTIALTQPPVGAVADAKAPEQKVGRPVAPTISADEARVMAELRALRFGTWFEFKPGGGKPLRLRKMSWFSTSTETCLFVDRDGMQAETTTMLSLAQHLLAQRARIIHHERKKPFVERALNAILTMLKASAPGASKPVQGRPDQGS